MQKYTKKRLFSNTYFVFYFRRPFLLSFVCHKFFFRRCLLPPLQRHVFFKVGLEIAKTENPMAFQYFLSFVNSCKYARAHGRPVHGLTWKWFYDTTKEKADFQEGFECDQDQISKKIHVERTLTRTGPGSGTRLGPLVEFDLSPWNLLPPYFRQDFLGYPEVLQSVRPKALQHLRKTQQTEKKQSTL